MFLKRIELFSILGFRVSLDLSWFLLAILITWTLTKGYFPSVLPGEPTSTYLWMAVLGALGLFLSIILHEFAHAIVARRYNLAISGITLFVFGGVAEMTEEPERPMAEFMMAIAGPIMSFAIAGVCYFTAINILPAVGSPELTAIVSYLALINFILALFNLLPAFPLDGGRVLRSILWGWIGDLRRATKIASRVGAFFGALMMAYGVVSVVMGNTVGGIWMLLLGFFVYNAAGASRMQAAVSTVLKGLPISKVMKRDPVTVSSEMPIGTLVEEFFYAHHHRFFPVVDNGRLKGCVTVKQVSEIGREHWRSKRVGDFMTPASADNTLPPDQDSMQALQQMQSSKRTHFMVARGDRLEGVVTVKDVMAYLGIHLELERDEARSGVPSVPVTGAPRGS